MTGRALAITQRQARALAKGAKEAGCIAEVQIGKTIIRLIPEDRAIPEGKNDDVDQYKDVAL